MAADIDEVARTSVRSASVPEAAVLEPRRDEDVDARVPVVRVSLLGGLDRARELAVDLDRPDREVGSPASSSSGAVLRAARVPDGGDRRVLQQLDDRGAVLLRIGRRVTRSPARVGTTSPSRFRTRDGSSRLRRRARSACPSRGPELVAHALVQALRAGVEGVQPERHPRRAAIARPVLRGLEQRRSDAPASPRRIDRDPEVHRDPLDHRRAWDAARTPEPQLGHPTTRPGRPRPRARRPAAGRSTSGGDGSPRPSSDGARHTVGIDGSVMDRARVSPAQSSAAVSSAVAGRIVKTRGHPGAGDFRQQPAQLRRRGRAPRVPKELLQHRPLDARQVNVYPAEPAYVRRPRERLRVEVQQLGLRR